MDGQLKEVWKDENIGLDVNNLPLSINMRGVGDKNAIGEVVGKIGKLELVGINPDDLGVNVLEIGIGTGIALSQGRKRGINMYGIELYDRPDHTRVLKMAVNEDRSRNPSEAVTIKARYRDYIYNENPMEGILSDESVFDTVFSALPILDYARNERDVVTLILEMIRVARGRVVFRTNYDAVPTGDEIDEYGRDGSRFEFALVRFLARLGEFGVKVEWDVLEGEGVGSERDIVNAHLWLFEKNQADLDVYKDTIFDEFAPR